MRIDPGYCRHVLALAAASGNEDLRQIGLKLEEIYFGENGLFMRATGMSMMARAGAMQAGQFGTQPARMLDDGIMMPGLVAVEVPAADRAYIGRLR